MKTTRSTVEVVTYASSLHPRIETTDASYVGHIQWADDVEPSAWRVVMGHSRAWGKGASAYPAYNQGDSPGAVLARVAHLHHGLADARGGFFARSMRFSLDHCRDRGLKSGFFQQHDGTFPRGCAFLDYTPETLGEVVDRFLEWCGPDFKTKNVTVDRRVVRSFARAAT